jgi:hypothetical protein
MDMGIAHAVDPLMLAMPGNLKETRKGRDGRPRNVTGLEGKVGVNTLSGVELLASKSESWLSGSSSVDLRLGSMALCVHGF